jgi:hypothetical protein
VSRLRLLALAIAGSIAAAAAAGVASADGSAVTLRGVYAADGARGADVSVPAETSSLSSLPVGGVSISSSAVAIASSFGQTLGGGALGGEARGGRPAATDMAYDPHADAEPAGYGWRHDASLKTLYAAPVLNGRANLNLYSGAERLTIAGRPETAGVTAGARVRLAF